MAVWDNRIVDNEQKNSLRLIIPLVSFGTPRPNKKIIKYYIFKIFLMKYLTLRR